MTRSSSIQPAGARPAAASAAAMPQPHVSKREHVLAMLGSKDGASLAEIIAATGWQPHSARAMLSTLRKQGHTIIRTKAGAESRYRIGDQS